jgi:hypothetical protein
LGLNRSNASAGLILILCDIAWSARAGITHTLHFNPTMTLIGPVQTTPPVELKVIQHGVEFNPAIEFNLTPCEIISTPPAGLI